jgi:hypothetical protein
MDRYWFIILFFVIVVAVPVIAGVVGDVYKRRMKLKERELELLGTQTAEKAAQYAAQTERLEQRVRVLERIITDRGIELSNQIEALRETPRLNKPLN